jgi:hypothetical protein
MSLHTPYLQANCRNEGTYAGLNLLKPTGYVVHQQVQQSRILHSATVYLCVLDLSQNK